MSHVVCRSRSFHGYGSPGCLGAKVKVKTGVPGVHEPAGGRLSRLVLRKAANNLPHRPTSATAQGEPIRDPDPPPPALPRPHQPRRRPRPAPGPHPGHGAGRARHRDPSRPRRCPRPAPGPIPATAQASTRTGNHRRLRPSRQPQPLTLAQRQQRHPSRSSPALTRTGPRAITPTHKYAPSCIPVADITAKRRPRSDLS